MNKQQIQGRMQQIAGLLERAAGKLMRNRRLEVGGLTRQVLGGAQRVHGDIRTRIQKRKLTPF